LVNPKDKFKKNLTQPLDKYAAIMLPIVFLANDRPAAGMIPCQTRSF
jgi:hypothetical protein